MEQNQEISVGRRVAAAAAALGATLGALHGNAERAEAEIPGFEAKVACTSDPNQFDTFSVTNNRDSRHKVTTVFADADGTLEPPFSYFLDGGETQNYGLDADQEGGTFTVDVEGETETVEVDCEPDDTTTTVPNTPSSSSTSTTSSTTTTTQPAGNGGTPEACPPGEVPDAGFLDVADSVHAESINCAAWYDLVRGRNTNRYDPSGEVTRGQLASFVANLLKTAGLERPANVPDAFADDNGTTHEPSLNWLAQRGIIRGKADGTSGHADTVNRAQTATYIVGAYEDITGEELPAGDAQFRDDAEAGMTHRDNIRGAANAGIIFGTSAETYEPKKSTRRDQMASLLIRTLEKLAAKNSLERPN